MKIIYLLCISKYFYMKSKDYLKDISEIKDLMNKSSRFISLSGLSGILAGIYALIGAYISQGIIDKIKLEKNDIKRFLLAYDSIQTLFLIAIIVVFLSIITGIYLTNKKAKKQNERILDKSSIRLIINFIIPLITGGIFCIILIDKQYFDLIVPTTLMFYGLSCVNASKYTLGNVRYLGIANIILGLISTQFIIYSLLFWALGFGVFHIIYGTWMYFKYDKN